jgi:Subtilase family
MKYGKSSSGSIPVASESEVAQWTRGRSRGRTRPIEAVEVDGRPQSVFVADQLLVDGRDSDLVDGLVERYGAEVIPRKPLPPAPEGLGPKSGVVVEDMPLPVLLRVSNAPVSSKRAAELLRASFSKNMSVTSESAARLAGLVAELAADGKQVGLNVVSTASTLPLLNPTDWVPFDPLSVAAYAGKARVAAAWQLIEVFREFRSTKPVTIGILDSGFWLNGFSPGVANGQPGSDLGSSVIQLNLLDEGVSAGGASGMPTSTGFDSPWHGNKSASVASAKVGNGVGASGVGGTVATPVLFKTDGSLDYYFRCLHVCLAWGLDVLNMSLDFTTSEFWFPTTAWDTNFQYAFDAGLIMVAAAGNSGTRLPEDDNPRPATRTPGTITVGALDGANQAQSYSNYGSSINVWAPTDIPVIPDDNSQFGSTFGGTSASAPFVSGILAMMRAVAPINTLSAPRAKQLLEETGWRGTGRVGIGVDAYTAVLAAMGGRLPDDASEAHTTPQTARQLKAGAGGVLMPFRLRSDPHRDALSSNTHSNWYKFEAHAFSRFDLQLRSYPLLGAVSVTLEPDDDSSRALAEMVESRSPGFTHLVGLIPPGSYKVHVRGPLNLYELAVSLTNVPLPADQFEPNESLETSTRFRLLEPSDSSLITASLAHPGGIYDLTLHTPNDKDFFRIEPIAKNPLSVPVARVSLSDLPLDITLFDASHNVITKQVGVHSTKLTLPRAEISFIEISGTRATRYRLTLRLEVDSAHLPGPVQQQEVIPLPDLGDPPFRIDQEMNHVLFQVDASRTAGVLALAAVEGQPMKVELLDNTGTVVRTAQRRENSSQESVELDVTGLQPGAHVLRVWHADAQSSLSATPLNVQVLPSFV